MDKKFRSISWKIWNTMTLTIVVLIALIFLANITILSNIKQDFIFSQLIEASKVKSIDKQAVVPTTEQDEVFLVAHFRIENIDGYYNIIADRFTKSLYIDNKNNSGTINNIVDNISLEGISEDRGIIKDKDKWHYYYVKWDDNGKGAMVFLTTVNNRHTFSFEFLIVIIGILIISFFISRIVAKRIAKPIQQLELFASEVSKRNWNAVVPNTDPDEIGRLAKSLEKMKDSLRIAEERDREFLHSTSHDLKTPVMIIKGYAQAILDGVNIGSQENVAEVIRSEAERLERRITQLLRLNTLGHSLEYNSNREIVRVDRLLKSLISRFSIIRPELVWRVHLQECEVLADPEALQIAFENIFENQLRYSKSLVVINMSINEQIEITISNDGPKFHIDNPIDLFDAYKKDNKEGNFGLGLAIVKQVIQAHNGSVTAHNNKNGVTFIIKLTQTT